MGLGSIKKSPQIFRTSHHQLINRHQNAATSFCFTTRCLWCHTRSGEVGSGGPEDVTVRFWCFFFGCGKMWWCFIRSWSQFIHKYMLTCIYIYILIWDDIWICRVFFSELRKFEWWIQFEYVWRAEGPDIQATQRREGYFLPGKPTGTD